MPLRAEIRGPRGILCTRGEKEHTSKRVSIIACDDAISKVQCATHLPEGNPCKSDDAMFLPLAKAMHLRRDVCLWHVADK